MNEAEQTSRLHSMNEKELVKWEKHLIRDIADIQATIADTDRSMTLEYIAEAVKEFPTMLDKFGTAEQLVACRRDWYAGTQSRRRARMITRQRRLDQIQRRLADVRSGAPLSSTPAPVDKEAKRVWRRLVAEKREAFLYAEYSRKHGLRSEGFEKRIAEIDEKMKAIAGGGK